MNEQSYRVVVSKDNPSIERIEDRCIKCGLCAGVCSDYISVHNNYDIDKTINPICVNCGQCVKACPTNALVVKEEYKKVKEVLKDKNKVVIISTSPSVRVALGEAFGMAYGSFVQDKMVGALKQLGFNYVLDTNFGADLTICEEATELIERIVSGGKLPQFTSCCPAWIKFAEIYYPEILPNISSCKSPIGMQGPIIKTYFAKKMGIDPKNIVNVALTPCVAKKMEIKRNEMSDACKFNQDGEYMDMDYCITTTELATWLKEEGIDFDNIQPSEFDSLLGQASGAGVIFGNTGGVMEAAVRTAYTYLTHKEPGELLLNYEPVRGMQEIRQAQVKINDLTLNLCVVYGLKNARIVLDQIKNGVKYDFVEIMTCPGGCIGGGGQPKHIGNETLAQQKRIKSLYERDKGMTLRTSHTNTEIIQLYDEFLGERGSKVAKQLLHTVYSDKSQLLNDDDKSKKEVKKVKYRCLVCGAIFEVPVGEEPVCPQCLVGKEMLEIIE